MPRTHKATPETVFCQLLRETRTGRGVTQVALAEALGFQQTDISKVERGARRLDILELRGWLSALELTLPVFTAELEARLNNLEALGRSERRGKLPIR